MKIIIINDNKRRNYYDSGDIVKNIKTNTNYIVKDVDVINKRIVCTDGTTLDLTTDIKPTNDTLANAKVIDKRENSDVFEIKVKYFDENMPELNKISIGDWVDVRVASISKIDNTETAIKTALQTRAVTPWFITDKLYYNAGDVLVMRLGVAMQFPKGYEAEIKPRSSTFANYGLLLTNSVGCIDESYCGDNDEWILVYYATRNGEISKYDRVGQFRINEKMPQLQFTKVESLGNADRNGFGSTGIK